MNTGPNQTLPSRMSAWKSSYWISVPPCDSTTSSSIPSPFRSVVPNGSHPMQYAIPYWSKMSARPSPLES